MVVAKDEIAKVENYKLPRKAREERPIRLCR
jgi:hypothetical protein